MGVFAFDEVQFTDPPLVDELFRRDEAGRKAADLAHHQLAVAPLAGLHDGAEILAGQRQRLFTQNVFVRGQRGLDHLPVQLVGRDDNHCVQSGMAKQIAIVGVARIHAQLLAGLTEFFLVHVADGDQASLLMCLNGQHVRLGHAAA